MGASDVDRLRECRAFGTLAGMMSASVPFWSHFVAYSLGEFFRATQQSRLTEFSFEFSLVRLFLILGIFAFALGVGGVAGRWAGEHIVYPVRTGNDATATKTLTRLMIGGVGVTVLAVVVVVLWQVSIM